MATNHLGWGVFLLIFIMAGEFNASPYFPIQERKKCTHSKVHKRLAADCHGINLPSVPQHLNTGIEVLDLSFNRIRILHNKDFSSYTYVQYLYLGDNLISYIETNTFSILPYLEVLNMSLNAVHVIPYELFHLQNLRKLSMDFNVLNNERFKELQSLPAMPSLKYLSLANCMLKEFPPLVKFPHIEFLNVSGNSLSTISAQQVAPACLLNVIDVNGNTELLSMSACTCAGFKSWAALRHIVVHPSLERLCSPLPHDMERSCTNVSLKETDDLYSTCKTMYLELQSKEIWHRVWVYLVLGLILCMIVVSFFVVYWRMCRKPTAPALAQAPEQRGAEKNLLSSSNDIPT